MAMLVVALASVVSWVASRSEVPAPTADDPVTMPETDGADGSPGRPSAPRPEEPTAPEPDARDTEQPPTPAEEADPPDEGEPAEEGEPPEKVGPPSEGFRDETGTVLLFDDGNEGALAVDLDTWRRERIALPGQRPGDQPVRLARLGARVVVGWETIWAVVPGRPTAARQLGEATIFVPHADPEAVWLIDYAGAGVGVGTSSWTLVDTVGTELAMVPSAPAGLLPVRGVPGGLVVSTPNGTLVYDLAEDRFVDTPLGSTARVAGVGGDRIAWCEGERCERLVITDAGGRRVAAIGTGERFTPSLVWVSPDGQRLAAWAWVQVGAGIDLRLRIYRTADGERVADTQVSLGQLFGDWTTDGRQFFAWTRPQSPGAPADLFRWSGGADIERLPVDDHGIRDVASFLALPSDGFDELLPDRGAADQ